MYPVSQDYLDAIATDPVHTSIELRFWTNGTLAFTMHDRNIVTGSLSIQKQCMNNDGFNVGGVYAGEFNVTIMPDSDFDVFEYPVTDAEIRVIYKMGLYKQNGSWVYENIPLGRFYVDDIDLHNSGIEITAYDRMLVFGDTDISSVIKGNAYTVINALCELAGVNLGTPQSAFSNFINHNKTFRIKPKWVDNARDALSYVCAAIGCFATMGRTGDLEIRPLNVDFIAYDDSLSRAERLSSLTALGFTRVKRVRSNFITEVTDKDGETKKEFVQYKASTNRAKGGVLDLGENPVVWENQQAVVNNLASEFYQTNYTAAKWETISNPIYDLGDRLRLVHPENNRTIVTLLTAVNWKYHGVESHEGYGSDKGVIGKAFKSINATNEVVAGNETISVNITINAGEDDIITVKDEENNTLTTVTFATGASTGTTTLDIPANGAILTFTSTVYGQSVQKMIEGDDEVTVSITVNITILSTVDDIVTIKDENGVTLATVNCPEV